MNNYTGQYFELEINKPVETGAPFGLVELIDIERVDHFYISSKENSSVTIYSVLNDRLNIQKENSDADIRAYLYCSVK